MFNNMIVAVDGSEQSLKAAEKALGIAKASNAHVYVVYVVDRTISKSDVFDGITKRRKLKFELVEKAAKKEGVFFEVKIIRGEPALAIVQFAEEVEADLIVIGSRGLNQFQQMVLGSVSHKVLKKASCPVMIIK